MSRAVRCIAVGIAALLSANICRAAEPPTLQERMSKEEFHAAELDKLSPEALKRLNDWLAAHPVTVTVKETVSPSGKPVFYPESAKREKVESRIVGAFTGWNGNTAFKLDNGQEWVQAESGRYGVRKIEHPRVRIEPMMLGSWLMTIDGCECRLRVERTK
jgi:hypothetical protein